jgi:hypothetical protein
MYVQVSAEVQIVPHIRLLSAPEKHVARVEPVVAAIVMTQGPTAMIIVDDKIAVDSTPAWHKIGWIFHIVRERLTIPEVDSTICGKSAP